MNYSFKCFSACLMAAAAFTSVAEETPSGAAILQDLRSFREMGSVLYVAAHPDDENTLLIAYLARGKNYRTAYLSLTRGDGGQNVLGADFEEKLGVARTQELLAARRLDGGRQFFTRAIDFGFSKDYRETLNIWDREKVVSDIVRVIRTFRPDVIVTRFSPQPGGTHGHHTCSAVLAVEAFKLAGDSSAFPDQLQDLKPWQPKRILSNGRGGGSGENIRLEISGDDPVLGISFSELASRSRGMHKTQFGLMGGGGGRGPRTETFQLLAGDPATNDIMDDINITWSRVEGGAEIGAMTDEIIAAFNPESPSASVPALLRLRSKLATVPIKDSVVAEKRAQLDRILQACIGLEVETLIPQAEVVPGENLNMRHSIRVRSDVPVKWVGIRYVAELPAIRKVIDLPIDGSASREFVQRLPQETPLTHPYWLREPGTPGMFRIDDPKLIGVPENPPAFPIEHLFEVGGQSLLVPDFPVRVEGETRRRLDVIPPVTLKVNSAVALFTPGSTRSIEIGITSARANSAGTLKLEAPAGWTVSPASHNFNLKSIDDTAAFRFTVTAPKQTGTAQLVASAEIGGVHYRNQRVEVSYRHLPFQLLQPIAAIKAISVDFAVRGQNVGYLPGAGDNVAEGLEQMGCKVTMLSDSDLDPERLKGFDAVVVGVRALNVRTNIAERWPALFSYAEQGGTVIVQYNRPGSYTAAPFNLRVSGDRVTDENAPVKFLAPEHPVLNAPNKIGDADFAGWIQERGLYFPNQWADNFVPIIECGDANETPSKGGLLVASHGKGYFVYTGLAFFRQLPGGVPGAYRLFANLVSLGKTGGAETVQGANQ